VVETIEKNPLFHFYPGSKSLFFGLPGCNVFSDFCSSFELSKGLHEGAGEFKHYTPDEIVAYAEKQGCNSITYAYTEPFVSMEFNARVAKLAHRSNIKNTFVTNGFVSEDTIKKFAKYIDAITVNIKASSDLEFYQKFMNTKEVDPIFDMLKRAKKYRIFVEITNLIVPQLGDNLQKCSELAQWLSSEISSEIPFHILPFYPEYAMTELPATPTDTLKACASEAVKTGLRYVYIDNSPIITGENTYCYNCGELLVERLAGTLKKLNLVDSRCPACGVRINIVR
jgi:pyruvate formate lyase activating enzyme